MLGGYYILKEEMPELVNRLGAADINLNTFAVNKQLRDLELNQATKRHGYFFLSVLDTFCENGKCSLFDNNGIPFTYDKHHLSFEFSSKIAVKQKDKIALYLQNVMSNSKLSLVPKYVHSRIQ